MAKRKQTPAQQKAWEHSSLVGCCWMARKNAERIAKAKSATDLAQALAEQIVSLTYTLAEALKERR